MVFVASSSVITNSTLATIFVLKISPWFDYSNFFFVFDVIYLYIYSLDIVALELDSNNILSE